MSDPRKIIDVHAHILPGVDDGAKDMKEAREMLLMAISQGVTGVIATPHYSRHRNMRGLEQLTEALEGEIREYCPDFFVCLGQETYYHNDLVFRLQKQEALTMAGSSYVLVEFAETVSYNTLFQGIRRLLGVGYRPVLAHVERYGCLRRSGLEELLSIGCYLQMNYDSLCGSWLQSDVRWCRSQVKDRRIHLLATDMHRPGYRPPAITKAWKWLENHVSLEQVERMTYHNPLRIMKDEKMI